jgi:hypothetical protein
MTLDDLIALARPGPPGDGPTIRLEEDDDLKLLVAWFGRDRSRASARIVVRGTDAGVVDRAELRGLFTRRTLGWGDSVSAFLPGRATAWEPFELRCPVAGCPASPAFSLHYDPGDPPACDVHPDSALRP